MNENGFGEHFVWYEWSFVSPSDMPEGESERERSEETLRPIDLTAAPFNPWEVASP